MGRDIEMQDLRSGDDQDTRHMSRGLAVVDHLKRDGVAGFLTITGGKLTTYRLMAEIVVDAMCRQLLANTVIENYRVERA